ncbi:MAG: Fe-S cluster assembly protein SufD, partial [Alphaproteobacteria bacterium]
RGMARMPHSAGDLMSAEPRTLKTEAELAIADAYRSAKASLPGSLAVAERRDAAFNVFENRGLPHRRIEAWKYTDLRARLRSVSPIAATPAAAAASHACASLATFGTLDRYRLVIADGHFQEALSDREVLLAEGVEVVSLAEFLTFESDDVLKVFDSPEAAQDDAIVALNAALATDGVVIFVPDGCTPAKPIEIVHLSTSKTGSSWFARSFAKIGRGAAPRLLVSHVGPDGASNQTNSYLAVDLAEGGDASIAELQAEGDDALHIGTFSARLATNASLRHLAVIKGAASSRSQSFAAIDGEGARIVVAGANMIADGRHGDVSWHIDHRVPEATSRVIYKNVVADESFGAFQGLILVRPDAHGTDGRMMTRTLLLSDEAQFAAKPELEIYADDVQCGHGATIGQVDESALFYLMARGIQRVEAEALLVRAFLFEAVDAIPDRAVTSSLENTVSAWLKRRFQ